jgi:hypothetical protein
MTMLQGYARMVDFFTSLAWWQTSPHDDLVSEGAYCLAKPGEIYSAYLPNGGSVAIRMAPGNYVGFWYNPTTGEKAPLPKASGGRWSSPPAPGAGDWALLLQKAAE